MLVVELAVTAATVLLSLVKEISERYEAKGKNGSVCEELRQFVQFLESELKILNKSDPLKLQDNLQAIGALEKLKTDLEEANSGIKKIKEKIERKTVKDLFGTLWKSKKIGCKIRAIRKRLNDSFVINLQLANLHEAIETRKEVKRISEMQRQILQQNESSTIDYAVAESSTLTIDVEEQYCDPITFELMCDPVKATDGHTYDRWTIVRNPSAMAKSPFGWTSCRIIMDEDPERGRGRADFAIAADDLGVRSRLFRLFPEQEEKFRQERRKYRSEAMTKADEAVRSRKDMEEALSMLDFVLQWDPKDGECAASRRRLVQEAGTNTSTSTSTTTTSTTTTQQMIEEEETVDDMCFLQFCHYSMPVRHNIDAQDDDLSFLAFPIP